MRKKLKTIQNGKQKKIKTNVFHYFFIKKTHFQILFNLTSSFVKNNLGFLCIKKFSYFYLANISKP